MKSKKSALLKSLIALLLCLSMLVGTTFAWFTDSVSTGINTIAAGNLDVELYHTNAAAKNEKVESDTDLFLDLQGEDILWEPGVVSYENLRICNEGDLALAYQMSIATANENHIVDPSGAIYGLSQILKVGVVEGGITATDRAGVVASVGEGNWITLGEFLRSGSLLPEGAGEAEDTWGVVIYWQPGEDDNRWNLNNGKVLDSGEALQIDLGINLIATQEVYESDSFGSDYDTSAKAEVFPEFVGGSASAPVVPDGNNCTSEAITMTSGDVTAVVPAGVQLAPGTTQLTLTVTEMEATGSNVQLNAGEAMRSLDVHIEGIDPANTAPITVALTEVVAKGLNMGNYKLYHVENGTTNEMTLVDSAADFSAHNQFKYDPATGNITLYMASFSEVAITAEPAKWKGNFNYEWYDADAKELIIANADQLAAFGAIVGGMKVVTAKDDENYTYTYSDEVIQDSFSGKTVKLISDINLGDGEENNVAGKIFYPIGYWNNEGTYERKPLEERTTAVDSGLYSFMGTFDGNGHTIANFYHNTWEMKGDHNWYDPIKEQYYRDGMGLFGRVYKGTVKNLTVDNFKSDGEIATTGVIAAYADGATFENIAITNCNPRVYNIGNGGIVGCVGWYAKEAGLKTTFKNITVDNSNKISALWGSYDVACGGIVGQYYPTSGQTSAGTPKNGGVHFENCHVSAIMDVYNDVCANYQYYAYRYTGMLIGSVRENVTIDGHSYPKMDGITAENCTVHFGTWNDYYYCEIIDNTTASYTHDYQMSRLTEIKAINGTTITYLDGSTGTVPASGRANYVVVNGKHATENATCYHFKDGKVWNHEDGGKETINGVEVLKEDKQHIYLEFNNLVTGYGWGVTSKGLTDFEGVTNMDITEGDQEASVKKFAFKTNVKALQEGKEYALGVLFSALNKDEDDIADASVTVGITDIDGNESLVEAVFDGTSEKWENKTIKFTGTGTVEIIIQDYQFCTPTVATVTIDVEENIVSSEKFEVAFDHDPNTEGRQNHVDQYLYRVGNLDKVPISALFAQKENVEIGEVVITSTVGTVSQEENWLSRTIDLAGYTGLITVTITDGDDPYCSSTELKLEVVTAKNATNELDAINNNVVLLNNCSLSGLEVSNGCTFYGNGFTMSRTSDEYALSRDYAWVTLDNGTLDNVQIIAPNCNYAVLYDSNKKDAGNSKVTDSNGTVRYYNIKSAVLAKNNSSIVNCNVSGGRAAVYVPGGNVQIVNTTITGGAAANIHVGTAVSNLTLRDITLIQKPILSSDGTKTLMGLSVAVMAADDAVATVAPITLEGYLYQYAWANESHKQYVPSAHQNLVSQALNASGFTHNIEGQKSVNLGFICLPEASRLPDSLNITDNRINQSTIPYGHTKISNAPIYSVKSANYDGSISEQPDEYKPNAQESVMPTIAYADEEAFLKLETSYDNGWRSTLTVDLDNANDGSYTFDFTKLSVEKYNEQLAFEVQDAAGNVVDKNKPISLNTLVDNRYTLVVTDKVLNKDGILVEKDVKTNLSFRLVTVKTSIPDPTITYNSTTFTNTTNGRLRLADTKSGDWRPTANALAGVTITYWDGSKTITLDLGSLDLSTGSYVIDDNVWTFSHENFTLKLTGLDIKTGYTITPIVTSAVDKTNKLFYCSTKVAYGTTSTNDNRSFNIDYELTNNNVTVKWERRETVNYANPTVYDYGEFKNNTLKEASDGCVTGDTLITMADGTQKRAEDLVVGDMIMVFNHVTGKVEAMPLIFNTHSDENEAKNYDVLHLQFSDGKEVKIVESHGLFDMTLMQYVYIDYENYRDYIGHEFYAMNSDGTGENVKLLKAFIKNEKVRIFCPVTYFHMNSFANGMLNTPNIPGDITGLVNYFEYDPDLKYNEESMQRDIEKYGLYSYADFSKYISEAAYNSSPSVYLKVAVGKGMITFEQILDVIEYLLAGSLIS